MTPTDMFNLTQNYTAIGLQTGGYVTRANLALHEVRDAIVTRRDYFPDRSYVGAVYDGKRNLVQSTLRFNERDIFPADPKFLDDISAASAQPSPDRTALYGGILFPILGHFFFESMARLWPLLWGRNTQERRLPVYFHPWPGLDTPRFLDNPLYRLSLEAIGIRAEDLKVIDAPLQFDTLIVPAPASAYHLNLDYRMVSIFDQIASSILAQPGPTPQRLGPGRNIYLSRSQWSENRRILNEEAIDAEMTARGFEIVHTQHLSPQDLMAVLVDTDTIVATDGSHAHMAAFCRPGIRIVMLDSRPVPTQFAISVLRQMRAVHVPLFQTPIYRMEIGITEPAVLGQLIDLCLAATLR